MEGLEPSHYWLIAAAIFLALEAFGMPGIGLLFAGLAAIFTGIITFYGVIAQDAYVLQFAVFMGLTGAFAALLWNKLKSWRMNASGGEYRNMIGDTAMAGKGGLVKGVAGQASWSGTTMTAELAAISATEAVAEGAIVEIIEVKGNRLIVIPKP